MGTTKALCAVNHSSGQSILELESVTANYLHHISSPPSTSIHTANSSSVTATVTERSTVKQAGHIIHLPTQLSN